MQNIPLEWNKIQHNSICYFSISFKIFPVQQRCEMLTNSVEWKMTTRRLLNFFPSYNRNTFKMSQMQSETFFPTMVEQDMPKTATPCTDERYDVHSRSEHNVCIGGINNACRVQEQLRNMYFFFRCLCIVHPLDPLFYFAVS